jgi:hypothetical protein
MRRRCSLKRRLGEIDVPIIGNNGFGPGGYAYLIGDLYGHFDPTFVASWGYPVPDCRVTRVYIRAVGSPIAETANLQFGIYNAASGVPTTYTLVATTGTLAIPAGAAEQWWSLATSIVLAAGTYALSVLDVNGATITWSVGIKFSIKFSGASYKAAVAGVFPNPLGAGVVATTQNWSMYADWEPLTSYAPTAACVCEPNSGVIT